jgi:hypothetical protein
MLTESKHRILGSARQRGRGHCTLRATTGNSNRVSRPHPCGNANLHIMESMLVQPTRRVRDPSTMVDGINGGKLNGVKKLFIISRYTAKRQIVRARVFTKQHV